MTVSKEWKRKWMLADEALIDVRFERDVLLNLLRRAVRHLPVQDELSTEIRQKIVHLDERQPPCPHCSRQFCSQRHSGACVSGGSG